MVGLRLIQFFQTRDQKERINILFCIFATKWKNHKIAG